MLVDQRLLPAEEVERAYSRWEDVADAIRTLVVRGAPAIGVAAAFGVALAARQSRAATFDALLTDLETAIKGLAATRPTAVNLFWALERMKRLALESRAVPLDQVRMRLLAEAQVIRDEDIDPTDTNEVLWALCTRTDVVDDVDVLKRCWSTTNTSRSGARITSRWSSGWSAPRKGRAVRKA